MIGRTSMVDSIFLISLHTLVVWPLIARVIMRRLNVSLTYTWLLLLIFLPIVGSVIYLLIGELNLGKKS